MAEIPPITNNTPPQKIHWVKLLLTALVVIGLSVLFYWVIVHFVSPHFTLSDVAWIAYLTMFGLMVLINLSILPLPISIPLMIAAAAKFNPVMIALVCSLGACVGEMNGYYAGMLGKKIAFAGESRGYKIMKNWIDRWGFWAIVFLSFQPILPIEVGGIIAGAAKMPVSKFFPALCVGKFPKYIILIYASMGLISFLPFLKG
jgi:membrane protein YqaA with SNARE-associated domain